MRNFWCAPGHGSSFRKPFPWLEFAISQQVGGNPEKSGGVKSHRNPFRKISSKPVVFDERSVVYCRRKEYNH